MKVAVLSGYQTKFGELWDKSLKDLLAEASWEALKESGLTAKELQAVFVGNMLSAVTAGQNHLGAMMAEILGINVPCTRIEAACASGGLAIAQACLAIGSGKYDNALVVGAEKMTDLSSEEISFALMGAACQEEREAGLSFPGLYALLAQEYFRKFEATEDDLAWVAVKNHYHASLNPKAQFPFEITLDQVKKSSLVASPLRLLDCSPVSDGAAAVVLSSESFAQKKKIKTPFIVASAQAADSLSLTERESLLELKATRLAAEKAFKEAALEKKDIDLAELHDCFTIAEVLALEDLGFYKKGEGTLAAKKNETKLGGKLPVNPSGGLKACGHPVGATGVKQIVEICLQLLGRAGKRQTKEAKVGLSHNVGGTGGTVVVHIIKI